MGTSEGNKHPQNVLYTHAYTLTGTHPHRDTQVMQSDLRMTLSLKKPVTLEPAELVATHSRRDESLTTAPEIVRDPLPGRPDSE